MKERGVIGRLTRVSKPIVTTDEIAGLGKRFWAFLIDGLIVGAVTVPTRALGADVVIVSALGLAVSAVNSIWLMARAGQTLGMMALRIKVVRADDLERPTVTNAVVRWVVFTGPGLVPGSSVVLSVVSGTWSILIFVTIFMDQWSRGLHDLAAGTVVVMAQPRASAHPPPDADG